MHIYLVTYLISLRNENESRQHKLTTALISRYIYSTLDNIELSRIEPNPAYQDFRLLILVHFIDKMNEININNIERSST